MSSFLRKIIRSRPVVMDVYDCSACGHVHHGVKFRQLTRRSQFNGQDWTHAGRCPNTRRKIFMRFLKSHNHSAVAGKISPTRTAA